MQRSSGLVLFGLAVVLFAIACTGGSALPQELPATPTPACEAPCHQIVVRLAAKSFEPAVSCTNPGRLRLLIENQTTQTQDVALSGPGLFQRLPLIEAGSSRMWETTLPGGSYVVAERQPPEGAQPRSAIVILKLDCSAPL